MQGLETNKHRLQISSNPTSLEEKHYIEILLKLENTKSEAM